MRPRKCPDLFAGIIRARVVDDDNRGELKTRLLLRQHGRQQRFDIPVFVVRGNADRDRQQTGRCANVCVAHRDRSRGQIPRVLTKRWAEGMIKPYYTRTVVSYFVDRRTHERLFVDTSTFHTGFETIATGCFLVLVIRNTHAKSIVNSGF